jgi:hypothetical protein
MVVDDDLKRRVINAIIGRYDSGVIRDVRLVSVEVVEDEDEIRFVFEIESDADPETIGKGYFGLTDRVRKALGDDWRGYFPILRPRIERSAAA